MHKGNTKGGNTRSDVNAAQRAQLALKLRAAKLPYSVIAEKCGYANKGAAYNAIQRELNNCIVEDVDVLRREEAFMLDQIHTECWALFMQKDNDKRLYAVDRVLQVSERRARLLGLDKAKDDIPTNATIIRQYEAEVKEV